MVLDEPIPDVFLLDDPILPQPDCLSPNIGPNRHDLEISHPFMSKKEVKENPPEGSPDIQVSPGLPMTMGGGKCLCALVCLCKTLNYPKNQFINRKAGGGETEVMEPGTDEPLGPEKLQKWKNEFRKLTQQEVMVPTAYTMGAEYAKAEETPQDLSSALAITPAAGHLPTVRQQG